MPPQGESVGLAIEDSILFARTLAAKAPNTLVSETFAHFERNRKDRIDAAYEEANWRWDTAKDAGVVATVLKEWATTAFLWWTKTSRDENFAYDVREIELLD
jgi:hypothetical protein